MRKYEIHLPLNYNDGEPIEQEKIRRVREELVAAAFELVISAISGKMEIRRRRIH